MEDGYVWGDASVTYPDWVGTAQLDERMTGEESIYTLTGLSQDEWFIVGLDIGGGESGHQLHVIATPRVDDDDPLGREEELQVTDFLIHDADPYDVLRRITHMFEFRLRVRSTKAISIRIVAHGDVPPQD